MNENNLFSEKIYIRFPFVKFHWIDSCTLQGRLIFEQVNWRTLIIFNLRKKSDFIHEYSKKTDRCLIFLNLKTKYL